MKTWLPLFPSTCLSLSLSSPGSFRTQFNIPVSTKLLSIGDGICLLGSCFSDNIGAKLQRAKWLPLSVNPSNGILYNPVSLADAVDRVVRGQTYTDDELEFNELTGLWSCSTHHSSFSSEAKDTCLTNINAALFKGKEDIRSSRVVFITLGTAWVFESLNTGAIVGNCHKLPQNKFRRKLLTFEECFCAVDKLVSLLLEAGVEQVILTVSPVRHIKEGVVENSRSKAHLLAASHAVLDKHNVKKSSANVKYFPSYEIMMDDLRDYRFYARDMLHPSEEAVDYIWERLLKAHFSPQSISVMGKISALQDAADHRPFNPKSSAHQLFIDRQIAQLEVLSGAHPQIDLSSIRAGLEARRS